MNKSFFKFLDIKLKLFGLIFILLLISSNNVYAISNKLNYQGRLLDKNNNPVSKTISVKFTIYDADINGTTLWTETKNIVVNNGYFSTILGDTTALNLDFGSNDYYLGIKFGEDSEMTPRKYIGAAPYATNASKLSGASAGTSANNVLKLGSSGNIDITGEIKTTGSLNVGSSSLASLTVSGTTNLNGTFQLNGTAISASATELNYVDGVTSGIQSQLDNKLALSGGTLSGNIVFSGTQTVDGIDISTIPSTYLGLSGGTMTGSINMGDANITNMAQLALTPRTTGTATEGYIYYDSDDDAFYGRTASDWINFTTGSGDITSVTAGTGLTGGGLSGDVTLNVAAADGTITVNADSIQVGTIGSANITDGAITAADLGADSVDSSELSSTAIAFGDIEAGDLPAAIDASKIAGGTVDNTEFGYLNGVTSAIQTQFSSYLPVAGGTMSGNIAFSGAQTVDGVDISGISSTYLALAGGTMAGDLTVNDNDIIGTTGLINYTNFDIDSGGSITIDNVGNTGSLTVESTVLDINDLTFVSAGTVGVGAGQVLTITANASSTWSTSAGTLTLSGIDDLQLTAAGDDILMNPSDDLTLTLAAGGQLAINAATTDNIVAGGALEIDIDTIGDNQTGGLRIDVQVIDDADALDVVYGQYISITHTSNNDDGVYGLYLDQSNTAGDVAATTALLALDNSETTNADDVVTAGILFLQAGAVGYTNAIDMSGVTTTNGINLGSNKITGTAYTIESTGGDITFDPSGNNILPGSDNTDILGDATNVWASGYYTNLLAGTGDVLTITANAASSWSTSAGTLTLSGANDLQLTAAGDDILLNPNDDVNLTLAAGGAFSIDAATTDNTTGAAFALDVDSSTDFNTGMYLTYRVDGSGGDKTFEGQEIRVTANSIAAADTVYGLRVATSAAGDSTIDSLIHLGHYDASVMGSALHIYDGAGGMTDGILIDADAVITDGVDVSDADITNAINIGANNIEGTNFDVDGSTGAITLSGKITNNNYAGSSSIDNGNTTKTVATTYISTADKIFISFTANPGGYWWISSVNNGVSFTITTSAACGVVAGCTFDYWIVK